MSVALSQPTWAEANTVKSAKLWASHLTYGAATITRLTQQDCTVELHCQSYESEELLSLAPSLQWEPLLPLSSCANSNCPGCLWD